ncbi:copper chaperone PCu(A)C [Deinococcus aquiradiocola]|uniref:Copper chaperone PCu(A)C n=1 Tax=Deinococcus aquiradiocola TaxID=393059 RepID=A0A917PK44_9DEIO|nr:copper chaperone PCu(A)C [Deinococcus aquiradiocola]GGJ81415.1 hypothetical protein GCM10008939_26790 [Deinococcus aquiradiocola]
MKRTKRPLTLTPGGSRAGALLVLCLLAGLGGAQGMAGMPGMTPPHPGGPSSGTATAPRSATPAVTSAAVKGLQLRQGWVAAAPPGAQELSAYLELRNPGRTAVRVTGVRTPVSGHAMLMTTTRDTAGRESMTMTASLTVPAGGTLKVLPGTAHLMLQALRSQPQPGQRVPLTLTFSDGSARTFTLPVRKW